ncbi:acyltransferase [Ruminococcus sp. HUN007]|uniref:acyltransferase family protein n=1 Tax=Ruminococcus sp. HUN007 TaxID=1514668 RepID=UPI0005D1CEFF|nr:acyltransferase [Ruminococcus sp. HUN007]
MGKNRIYYIDCLKGYAIILVVLGHIFDGYIKSGYFLEKQDFMCGGFNIIYSFHMALFFIISGFVYSKAYIQEDGTSKATLKTQLFNIVVIYFIFSLLFGVFKIICSSHTNVDVEPIDLLLLWLKTINPYWYLYVLAILYLLFSKGIIKHITKVTTIVILFIITFLSNYIPHTIGGYFEIKHIFYYAAFFGFGIAISKSEEKYHSKERVLSSILFSISIIIMVMDRDGFSIDGYNNGFTYWKRKYNLIIALGISMFLIYIFRLAFSNGDYYRVKVLSFLGRYSLEIYVIHCIFTAGNRVVLSKLHIDNFYLNISINTLLSIGIPVVISLICKKNRNT